MLCHNNWIEMSWDGLPQRVAKQNIQVDFNTGAKSILPFDRACDLVAEEIADCYKNIYVALSGGSDSECVANCLLRNRVPFTPLIIHYNLAKLDDQRYERWHALHWCKTHNVEPLCIDVDDYVASSAEIKVYAKLKPRLVHGAHTMGFIMDCMDKYQGHLVTGAQLEYYPDCEQMSYLEPQLGSYQGFVFEEADFYSEVLRPNRHPWAFFYWTPEIMASFVSAWDESLTMQHNKAQIYGTCPRPKYNYPHDIITDNHKLIRNTLAQQKWGTRDCALLGNKKQLLHKLLT